MENAHNNNSFGKVQSGSVDPKPERHPEKLKKYPFCKNRKVLLVTIDMANGSMAFGKEFGAAKTLEVPRGIDVEEEADELCVFQPENAQAST
ncbi:hypothetical protein L596_004553 [Steinernema carpocapsae]|uniref:Uncharacterized protein n=1 Tax=Steinernema carpocapsae TaxID=34508 RepID=A0A4U8UWA0_STECR|nr:hypothetical protein L596_004553 [Steinernema carpocapsae]